MLVADDEPDSADSLASLIRLELCCAVTAVYGGATALEHALAEQPHVAILDLSMPGLSGIDTARRVRHGLAAQRPTLVALTGKRGVTHELGAIDETFDHAFAKPADLPRLLAVLTAEARRQLGQPATTQMIDFGEMFTRAARQVVPLAVARHQFFAFDWVGPQIMVRGDPSPFHRSMHRLLRGAVDCLRSGFVVFDGTTRAAQNGHELEVRAAGTGPLAGPTTFAEVLNRLGLRDGALLKPGPRVGAHAAQGYCRETGAAVEFSVDPSEGVLLRWRTHCTSDDCRVVPVPMSVADARVWLIDAAGHEAARLSGRMQRLGWAVTRFRSCLLASLELTERPSQQPDLVIVIEQAESPDSTEATTPAALAALQSSLATDTPLVLAVVADSSWLQKGPEAPAVYLRVYPFGLADLLSLAALMSPHAAAQALCAGPPSPSAARGRVLVVDDHEVNRIVAKALLESLGYEVATASDGLDAIAQCGHLAPSVVLMDLDMRVLGGLDATRRLRHLQREGQLAQFGIVACTAHSDAHGVCRDAGMDGYLCKPLNLALLRAEMLRVMALG